MNKKLPRGDARFVYLPKNAFNTLAVSELKPEPMREKNPEGPDEVGVISVGGGGASVGGGGYASPEG